MPRLTEQRRCALIQDYIAGASTPSLRDKYGVSIPAIHWLLRKRGVTVRSYSEAFRKHTLNEHAFDDCTKEGAAYWIGFLMADGFVHRKVVDGREHSWIVSLVLNERDRGHVEAFQAFLQTNHGISTTTKTYYTGKSSTCCRLSVLSNVLAQALSRYGIVPRKSLIATACPELSLNRHFWRGVFDGDGCLWWRRRAGYERKTISCRLVGSRFMMEQFRSYLLTVCPDFRGAVRPTRTIYVIGVDGKSAMLLTRALYQNCSVALPRKKTIADLAMTRCDATGGLIP